MKFYVLRLVDWLPNAVSVQQIKNQLIVTVTGFATPLEYFVRADFPHQMSYLRTALLYIL
jgi:hypothetical protein